MMIVSIFFNALWGGSRRSHEFRSLKGKLSTIRVPSKCYGQLKLSWGSGNLSHCCSQARCLVALMPPTYQFDLDWSRCAGAGNVDRSFTGMLYASVIPSPFGQQPMARNAPCLENMAVKASIRAETRHGACTRYGLLGALACLPIPLVPPPLSPSFACCKSAPTPICRTWLAGLAAAPGGACATQGGRVPVAVALGPPVEEASTTLHHK